MNNYSSSGYDKIAPFYDDMVGLIYGKDIFDAEIHFLDEIPVWANVLIIGGGTGWILLELIKLKPHCKIWYIDSSAKMMELSKRKMGDNKSIVFITGTEDDIPANKQFDIIITNFYLDGFSNEVLPIIIEKIEKQLRPNGKWLVTEFVDTGWKKHTFLLWLMHVFFKFICKHPNTRLVDWEPAFKLKGFVGLKEKNFYDGFIKSVVFCKKNP